MKWFLLATFCCGCGSSLFSDDGRLRPDQDNLCPELIEDYYRGRTTLALACTAAKNVEGVRAVCEAIEPVVVKADKLAASGDCELLQETALTLDMDVRAIARTRRLLERLP